MKRILFHLLVLAQQKLSERRGSKTSVIEEYDEKGLLIYFLRILKCENLSVNIFHIFFKMSWFWVWQVNKSESVSGNWHYLLT